MSEGKERQRTTVSIYGQQYTVVGEDEPEHVQNVARAVDQKMREIKSINPYLDTTRLAVLTAINVMDDQLKQQALTEKERLEKDED
ncbi:cell division protein ZapA [Salsuginibacillus halophilus]|uniref:Cell division protein ZapA n=1 Tax=Salsuginibacillus halophilus TaxID=517424 RepID=A0A2P8HD38_9BACI|nr:cell division protein ZapA [Salsuginibacillus halophilus]PSL44041.1 cell division protein ZapA [Salsuginibacillus halophilus]